MARLLIVTTGLTGITNASLELARRLAADDHAVTLAAPRPVGPTVEAEGLPFLELPAIELHPEKRGNTREELMAAYRPIAFVDAVKDGSFDLLLIDVELHEYILASYGHGFPFLLLSQWYGHWNRPGLPYPLTDVVPGRGWAGTRLAMAAHWQKIRWSRKWMFAKIARRSGGRDRRSLLLALAQEYDFPRRLIRDSYWPGAFSYTELPALTMTPREMEFPHEWRPNLHYIGPMVRADRHEKKAVSNRGADAGAILLEARRREAKIICCTVSTVSGTDAGFLSRIAAAADDRPEWTIFIGTGKISPEDIGPVPENVHLFSYLPQLTILREADLSINHGGIHTIHECLHFRVPMLVYSGKQSDQPGCAARVEYHGVGLRADKDLDSREDIERKMERVLTDERYREAVAEMHRRLTVYGHERVAERTIAEFISNFAPEDDQ